MVRLSVAAFDVPGEADLVSHHVTSLVSSGVGGKDIAVIAPYNLQVSGAGEGRGGVGRELMWKWKTLLLYGEMHGFVFKVVISEVVCHYY